jgi:hypothetical protein
MPLPLPVPLQPQDFVKGCLRIPGRTFKRAPGPSSQKAGPSAGGRPWAGSRPGMIGCVTPCSTPLLSQIRKVSLRVRHVCGRLFSRGLVTEAYVNALGTVLAGGEWRLASRGSSTGLPYDHTVRKIYTSVCGNKLRPPRLLNCQAAASCWTVTITNVSCG